MSLPSRHSILPPSTTTTSRTSHNPNNPAALSTSSQSALQARINAKRLELQHLQSLRDLSATLATQMGELETKLGTLRNGAEAVACVMGNWEGVLGVIGMVGREAGKLGEGARAGMEGEEDGDGKREGELPVTLVRIPVEEKGEGAG